MDSEPVVFTIQVKATLTPHGTKMDISHDPTGVYAEEVYALLSRAAAFYGRQLQIMELAAHAQRVAADAATLKGLIIPRA